MEATTWSKTLSANSTQTRSAQLVAVGNQPSSHAKWPPMSVVAKIIFGFLKNASYGMAEGGMMGSSSAFTTRRGILMLAR